MNFNVGSIIQPHTGYITVQSIDLLQRNGILTIMSFVLLSFLTTLNNFSCNTSHSSLSHFFYSLNNYKTLVHLCPYGKWNRNNIFYRTGKFLQLVYALQCNVPNHMLCIMPCLYIHLHRAVCGYGNIPKHLPTFQNTYLCTCP